jgi:hypothetical protein
MVRPSAVGADICTHLSLGISAASGRPLSPPTDFRVVARPVVKGERAEIKQGKCHKCLSWVAIETVKNVEVKVRCLASLPTRA